MIHIDYIAAFGAWLDATKIYLLIVFFILAYLLAKHLEGKIKEIEMPRGRTSESTGQEPPHENHSHAFEVDGLGSGETLRDETNHIHVIEGWSILEAGVGRGAHTHIIPDQPLE